MESIGSYITRGRTPTEEKFTRRGTPNAIIASTRLITPPTLTWKAVARLVARYAGSRIMPACTTSSGRCTRNTSSTRAWSPIDASSSDSVSASGPITKRASGMNGCTSRTTTRRPVSSSSRTRCPPMKPAPPVTSVVRSETGLRSRSRVPMSMSGRAIPCVYRCSLIRSSSRLPPARRAAARTPASRRTTAPSAPRGSPSAQHSSAPGGTSSLRRDVPAATP